jgi:tetratricopeptide (TPR) repeat protein
MVVALVEKVLDRVAADPGHPESWMRLGYVYEANDLDSLALECYEHAVGMDDARPTWWYRLARIKMQLGDRPGVVEAAERVIELQEDYAPVHWRLGFLHLEQNGLEQARRQFERAVDIDANDPAGKWGLARVWLQSGQPEKTVALLAEFVRARPDYAYSHLLLGTAYRQLEQWEKAKFHLQRGLRSEPQFQDPWDERLQPYRAGLPHKILDAIAQVDAGELVEAAAVLEALRHHHPEDLTVLNNLAAVYVARKQPKKALQLFKAALRFHPDNAYLHLNAASVYQKLDQPSQAVEHLDTVIALDPRLGNALRKKGHLLTFMGNHEAAAVAYAAAVENEPHDASLFVSLGLARLELEQWQDGLTSFRRAAALDSTLGQPHLGIAVAARNLGNLGEAEAALVRAATLNPKAAKIQSMLAQIRQLAAASGGQSRPDEAD